MALSLSKGYTFANGEKISRAKLHALIDSATVVDAGTMAEQDADAVDITGGNAILSILAVTRVTQSLETGYSTSGTIDVPLGSASNAYIGLTGNSTFTVSSIAAGYHKTLVLKNTTGGSITLTWPAWATAAGVTLPTSLAAGAFLVIRLYAIGTTTGDIIATYN